MSSMFRKKKSQRRVALLLFLVGVGIWAGWLWYQHLGAQGGVSMPLGIGLIPPVKPLSLPSLDSIASREGLPKRSMAWEDFSRQSQIDTADFRGGPRWQDGDYSELGLKKCPNLFAPQKCRSAWGNAYVQRWQTSKEIPKLCESNALSAIHCHDSPLLDPTSKQEGTKKKKPTRFCEFKNTMINFKRMRTSGGKRSFERGFLASSCGYTSPENIGINVYNPDIVSQSCDFVLNETVVVYSHSNVKRAWTVLKDYWGLFTMLQLAGARTKEEIKQMSLLNVDSLVRGQASYFNEDRDDDLRGYFYVYHRMFRRVIRASDFPAKSSVCFKRLLWLSRPSDLHRDIVGPPSSPQEQCTYPREGSDFFHRWSAFTRSVLGVLGASTPSPSGGGVSTRTSKAKHSSNYVFQVLLDSSTGTTHGGGGGNSLAAALSEHRPAWKVAVADLSKASTRRLIELYSNASLVVTTKGSEALLGAAFMPLGTRYCCGIVEVGVEAGGAGAVQSFEAHARFMGHVYGEVTIHGSDMGADDEFLRTVYEVERGMVARPSCVSSDKI